MKKIAVALVVLAALTVPAAALAHPLGNFSVNRYSDIELSGARVYVHYVLDLAEIPTFQDGADVRAPGFAARAGEKLVLELDGERVPLVPVEHELRERPGAGGLPTLRFEAVYEAPARTGPQTLVFHDTNFDRRVGWREIVVGAGEGARLSASSAPRASVSDALRAYPRDLLRSPLDVRSARVAFEPGTGPGVPPALGEADRKERSAGGFEALVTRDLGLGVVLVSLLAAVFWGAAHALTPGHGKAIVAAYMVGARGTVRHALLLGGIVTVTHTIGVFALGIVTLSLSEFVVPEHLYPWVNLVSALLVVAVGLAVLRLRVRDWFRAGRAHHDHDDRHRGHGDHGDHHHGHSHAHDHEHDHVPKRGSGLRGLVAVGVSGGLLPCPTALVVLLAAVSLHRVAYGLVLIVAFSLGLAATISGIGLLAVTAKRVFARMTLQGPVVRLLPAVSALVIVGLGIAMAVRTAPTIA